MRLSTYFQAPGALLRPHKFHGHAAGAIPSASHITSSALYARPAATADVRASYLQALDPLLRGDQLDGHAADADVSDSHRLALPRERVWHQREAGAQHRLCCGMAHLSRCGGWATATADVRLHGMAACGRQRAGLPTSLCRISTTIKASRNSFAWTPHFASAAVDHHGRPLCSLHHHASRHVSPMARSPSIKHCCGRSRSDVRPRRAEGSLSHR